MDSTELQKTVVARLDQVYTVNDFQFGEKHVLACGSEGKNPSYMVDMDNYTRQKLCDSPGGTMGIIPDPSDKEALFSVMGLFPPFVNDGGGVYKHWIADKVWKTRKLFDLPFAHRAETIHHGGEDYLIVASVSRFKIDPGDWRLPGELFVIPLKSLQMGFAAPLPLKHNGITRNHGMSKVRLNGTDVLYISGAEGIFSLIPDQLQLEKWALQSVFDKEVSEFAFIDLDNDGKNELVTIEPFHGKSLNIYKDIDGQWKEMWSFSLNFGHGLSVGQFNGEAVIVVGNRAGDRALKMVRAREKDPMTFSMETIEEGTGPTQTGILHYKSKDYIYSANQVTAEVALYHLEK